MFTLLCRAKRVRFPKGKKVKPGDEVFGKEKVEEEEEEEDENDLMNPRNAAKERAKRRNQITAELFSEDSRGIINDLSAAEVTYEVCSSGPIIIIMELVARKLSLICVVVMMNNYFRSWRQILRFCPNHLLLGQYKG